MSRRDGAPRGVPTVHDRMLVAYRMVEDEGKTPDDVARFYGVKVGTVHGWLSQVRAARVDAHHLEALKR